MSITPGAEPDPAEESPLLADEPLPPGTADLAQAVEEIDEHIRSEGPEEVEEADKQADAVEGDAEDAQDPKADRAPGSDADADADPTSDEGADAEDPEAQQGREPGSD